MAKNKSGRKSKINNRKKNNRNIIQNGASPVKIAYYVQRLLEKNVEKKEIILIISSQFGNDAIREFAKMYIYCFYMEDIRRVANLIYNTSKRKMDGVVDKILHDIMVEKDILPDEHVREHIREHIK